MARPNRSNDPLQRMKVGQALNGNVEEAAAPSVSGRSLRPSGPGRPAARQRPGNGAVGGMLPSQPGGTPFAGSQVSMGTNLAPAQSNSNRILTLVLALIGVGGMAILAMIMIAGVGFFLYEPKLTAPDGIAGSEDIMDSGEVTDPELRKSIARERRRRKAAGDAVAKVAEEKASLPYGGRGAAPVNVTITGKNKGAYRGVEIICREVNFRKQTPFKNYKAYMAEIPKANCRLTFKGTPPQSIDISGGARLTCNLESMVSCR